MSNQNTERLLAAMLYAKPELLASVGVDPASFSDETARAVVRVLQLDGPAVARPGPLIAALRDLRGDTAELDGVEAIIMLAPEPDEVRISELTELKAVVEKAAATRGFKRRAERAIASIDAEDYESAGVADLRAALDAFTRSRIGRDHTAAGIGQRLGLGTKTRRWKCGAADLDLNFKGVGPDGNPSEGLLGQGELIVVAARYGVGKSRIVNNWVGQLLDPEFQQGEASVAMYIMEDSDTDFATRIIAAKENVAPWKLEQFATGKCVLLGASAEADTAACVRGLAWWNSLGGRIRIYDGEADLNIFEFREALELMRLDAALYHTTHAVIDFIQAWPGDETEVSRYAAALRGFAARSNVGLIEVSQLSNESIKYGTAPGQVAAKGSGSWGAFAHVGIELVDDPAIGQREVGIVVKKARKARRVTTYAQFNEETGKIVAYVGTPDYIGLTATEEKPATKRGGKR